MANKYTALPVPPKHELEKLYFNNNMTQSEIGIHYSTTQKVVFSWFKKHNIKSRVAFKRNQFGSNNSSWKERVTYAAYHYRVYAVRGKAYKCEVCDCKNAKRYEWANMTGKYEDTNDYKMMCVSCHHKKDCHRNNLPNRKLPPNINKKKLIDDYKK